MTPDKTEAQPEALRLAAEFEDCIRIDAIPSINDVKKSAAELRRQHAETEAQAARIAELEAQLSARQAAPDGWRLVPAEPTEEMVTAGQESLGVHDCYYAMLSAAPSPT